MRRGRGRAGEEARQRSATSALVHTAAPFVRTYVWPLFTHVCRRIDFVFVKQQVKGRVTKVKGTHDICFGAGEEVSDHFGVLVKLE